MTDEEEMQTDISETPTVSTTETTTEGITKPPSTTVSKTTTKTTSKIPTTGENHVADEDETQYQSRNNRNHSPLTESKKQTKSSAGKIYFQLVNLVFVSLYFVWSNQ